MTQCIPTTLSKAVGLARQRSLRLIDKGSSASDKNSHTGGLGLASKGQAGHCVYSKKSTPEDLPRLINPIYFAEDLDCRPKTKI